MLIKASRLDLSPLAKQIANSPPFYLLIQNDEENLDCYRLQVEALTEEVAARHLPSLTKQIESSLLHLKKLVGKKRLDSIFSHPELSLKQKIRAYEKNELLLTDAILKQIFLGLTEVKIHEVEIDAFYSFSHKRFRSLIPFSDLQDVFCKEPPTHLAYDHVSHGERSLETLKERIAIIFQSLDFHEKSQSIAGHSSFQEAELWDIEVLTSRLGDREPHVGTLIPLQSGPYYYDEVFSESGAHISVLKGIYPSLFPKIVCRSSPPRSKPLPGSFNCLHDLIFQANSYGVINNWPQLKLYLEKNGIRHIEIYGKGLGGAQAQYLTALIQNTTTTHVLALHTFCSTGIPRSVEQTLWSDIKRSDSLKGPPLSVQIWRNTGSDDEYDLVPFLGGVHLGASEKIPSQAVSLYHVYPTPSASRSAPVNLNLSHSGFTDLLKKHLPKGHSRQNTLIDCSIEKPFITHHLSPDPSLEDERLLLQSFWYYMTLGFKGDVNFIKFYNEERKR